MLYNIVFILTGIVNVYTFSLVLDTLLKEKYVPKVVSVLAYIWLYIMVTVPCLVINIPVVNLICSYSSLIIVTFIYKGNWKNRIMAGTFVFVLAAISESVVAFGLGYVGVDIFAANEYYSIFATVASTIAQFAILNLIRNLVKVKYGDSVSVQYWFSAILLPILSLYLMMLFYTQPHIDSVNLVLCTIAFLLINISTFYMYDKQMEYYEYKQQKELLQVQMDYQTKQLELMNESVEKNRALKHDMVKHITLLDQYIVNDKGEASEYINEIKEKILQQHKYVDTDNFAIDSLINYKISKAAEEGVTLNVEMKIVEKMNVSAFDINSLISNLIDNSIEAVRKNDGDNKRIDMKMSYAKGKLIINISNNYKEIIVDKKGQYLTTKDDSKNHGYGLKNIKTIVEKYEGVMKINTEKNVFEVFICLFL